MNKEDFLHLRIRNCIRGINFRSGDQLLAEIVGKQVDFRRFGPGDAVLLESMTKQHIAFVFKPRNVRGLERSLDNTAAVYNTSHVGIVMVIRIHVMKGRGKGYSKEAWDPLMLQNVAEEFYIHIDGLRRYEEIREDVRRLVRS